MYQAIMESFEKQNAFDMVTNLIGYTFGVK